MRNVAGAAIVYLFVVGVMLSGVYLDRTWGHHGRTPILIATLVVALPWLLYFRLRLQPRIVRLSTPGEGWRPSDDDET